jgi:hypothetical protein
MVLMIINLSPFRSDEALTVIKSGDVLTLNGENFDFSRMADGDTLPLGAVDSQWFGGPVDRVGADLLLTLRLPLPMNYSQEQAYPVPLANVPDGEVSLPQPQPLPLPAAEEFPIIEAQQ